jgi:hypothetical protein
MLLIRSVDWLKDGKFQIKQPSYFSRQTVFVVRLLA